MDFRKKAQEVIKIECEAIAKQQGHITQDFNRACEMLLTCSGRIVVMGMGKSGHIAGKIAATLASTGSPAFALHPAEAMHGDLGMLTAKDIVIAISSSGKTPELLALAPYIRNLNIPLIILTGDPKSPLASLATVHICVGVDAEACPLGLAPTASTTAALVMGDAIAVALLDARGFTKEQFAASHPGGNLGKRLLLKVKDFMHTGDAIPTVQPEASLSDALIEMTSKRLGMTIILDAKQHLLGLFTDGDVRRTLQKKINLDTLKMQDIMNPCPKSIHPEALASEAFDLMEMYKITSTVVVDTDHRVVGVVHLHDLLQGGL
jgi:arabinose-5-phosphate isomerase